MSQHESKRSHGDISDQLAPLLNRSDSSGESILKLRRLIAALMNEVESMEERSIAPPQANSESIDFYEEIKRFEIALIKRALRQTNGHQVLAARLLNLNPTTLHAKIKQYDLKS